MLAHTIKHVWELFPDTKQLTKQASLDQDFPVDSKDSCIASALSAAYLTHVKGETIPYDAFEKVANASEIYGVRGLVKGLIPEMVQKHHEKKAFEESQSTETFLAKVAMFEGELTGTKGRDYKWVSEQATALCKEAQERNIEPSDPLIRYSGQGFFEKTAAVKSMSVRYNLTKDPVFVKLAQAIAHTDANKFTPEMVKDLCNTVNGLDKKAGLTHKGYNLYNEVILTKEAALISSLSVTLAGTQVPYEKIQKFGKEGFKNYVGNDIAQEFDKGPQQFKQVLETLPLDMQRHVVSVLKNV